MRVTALALVCLACPAAKESTRPDAMPIGDSGTAEGGTSDPDAGGIAAGTNDASGVDGGLSTPAYVPVGHPRELRGVWIATVWNINWPSRAGLPAAEQRAELLALLDDAAESGLNAVFLQVRAECDALYASEHEPWSRFLTGTMGEDPGWDPLATAIEEAHARGLELHAWMNPYRALVSRNAEVASATHVLQTRSEGVVRYGTLHWLDPGNEGNLLHTLAVVRDLLERYDVDGLHFDDYFYPYPVDGEVFDDSARYAAYRESGGALERDEWRRDNVNRMVRSVGALVNAVLPEARFGISPFGIYRPGMPAGIAGLDAYAALYADPLAWMREGSVEYIAPQLYWPTTQRAQAFGALLGWWSEQAAATGTTLLIGHNTQRLGEAAWPRSELETQLELVQRNLSAQGSIHYHVAPLSENRDGLRDVLAGSLYTRPAAPPHFGEAPALAPPAAVLESGWLRLEHPSARLFAIYRNDAEEWNLERLVPASGAVTVAPLPAGTWAISAIGPRNAESLGVVLEATGAPDPEPEHRSCEHSLGGTYADRACSASFQCCEGSWTRRDEDCGPCLCEEASGETGCGA